jgi:hypothetical protein
MTTVVPVTEKSPEWIRFPGLWGELQFFHAPQVGTVALGTSPVGPAFKEAWRRPLATLASWPVD